MARRFLHQCIRPFGWSAYWLLATMDISAHAISLPPTAEPKKTSCDTRPDHTFAALRHALDIAFPGFSRPCLGKMSSNGGAPGVSCGDDHQVRKTNAWMCSAISLDPPPPNSEPTKN